MLRCVRYRFPQYLAMRMTRIQCLILLQNSQATESDEDQLLNSSDDDDACQPHTPDSDYDFTDDDFDDDDDDNDTNGGDMPFQPDEVILTRVDQEIRATHAERLAAISTGTIDDDDNELNELLPPGSPTICYCDGTQPYTTGDHNYH
jgi:hypothetical protein